MSTLASPSAPAAAWAWPMLDFTEPSSAPGPVRWRRRSGPASAVRCGRRVGLPVPWPSIMPTSSGRTPACVERPRNSRACAVPLGAVSPTVRPSWLTPVARTSAEDCARRAVPPTGVAARTFRRPRPRRCRWRARCRAGSGRRRKARAAWRIRRSSRASPSRTRRRPAPCRSRPTAPPARRRGTRPAPTSTRCRPSTRARPGPRCRRSARRSTPSEVPVIRWPLWSENSDRSGPYPMVGCPDVAAHVVAGEVVGVDPAVLQRPPGHPQRDPLLRIHRDGLARRDTEERGIESRRAERNPPRSWMRLNPSRRDRRAGRGPTSRGRSGTGPTLHAVRTAATSSRRRCRCHRGPRSPCRRSRPGRRCR